jgi:CRP/FNR family cyclic AMP-dependent transcriptional regulator
MNERFSPHSYLVAAGVNRRTVQTKPSHLIFSQGDAANSVFFLEAGRAKLVVVSKGGKEATVALLGVGDFIGEESLVGAPGLRSSTAIAITQCTALRLDREDMARLLHQKHEFSDHFLNFVLLRAVRRQEDLVDQLFNNSEKRLARLLLLMAEFGQPEEPEKMIPPITQEALAEMVGTTRSRVSKFMNRFRKLGYIQYNGRIHVHKSLLNVALHDRQPEQTAKRLVSLHPERTNHEEGKRARAV